MISVSSPFIWLLIFWAIVAFAGCLCFSNKRRLAERRRRFADREALQVSEIIDRHYSKGDVDLEQAAKVWKMIADTMYVDAERLRPSDRFDYELSRVKGYPVEDEIADLNDCVRKEAKHRGLV